MSNIKKSSDIVRKAAACLLACALASTNALVSTSADARDIGAKTPTGIASTSLCGDAYLLALLGDQAPYRIWALSWQSRDALSRAPKDMQTLPQAWDAPEMLLSLPADHIVFGPGEGLKSELYLAKNDTGFSRLIWGEDFAAVASNLDMLGEAIGEPRRAARLSARIAAKLEAMKSEADTRPKILYLSRAGGSAGKGTYVDAAISAAGGQNVMTAPGWNVPDPEFLIGLKPDLIITSFFKEGYESINAAPLRHKAVRDFLARHDRLDIPGALWPCAGPDLIEAAQLIHDKIETLP